MKFFRPLMTLIGIVVSIVGLGSSSYVCRGRLKTEC